jgi:anti-sigma factor ChrR (cupin superfamily)
MKLTALLLLSLAAFAQSNAPKKSPTAVKPKDVLLTPDQMKWMPAPAATGLPPVVQVSILSGDPFQAGPFVVRLKIPAGGKIAAHWHPTDEHITVLEGTFAAGMGDKFSEAALHDFPAGSYVLMPRTMHHFASAKGGDVVIQIHGQGPFVVNYVDPSDDPRRK